MKYGLFGLLALLAVASPSAGAIVITEAMSSSDPGDTGTGTPDWIELTNDGGAAVVITGYRIDDTTPTFANSRELLGVASIAPGESVIFIESSPANSATDIANFRTFWSGSATGLTGVQIGSYSGSGIGLSSGGDQVHLFNTTPAIVASVSFGAATPGASFRFPPSPGVANVAGQYGAYVSAGALGNVGSPGVNIPEPASAALAALASVMFFRRRRSA